MRLVGVGVLGVALLGVCGCAVHDGNRNMEPVWWPTAMVRGSTLQSSGGHLNVQPAPLDEWLPPLNPDGSLRMP